MNEQTIFASALAKKDPAERQAFLNEACGHDPALRAQVDEMLAADEGAGSFLEHPPVGLDATVDASLSKKDTVDNELSGALPILEPCDKPDRIGKLGLRRTIIILRDDPLGDRAVQILKIGLRSLCRPFFLRVAENERHRRLRLD